MNPIRLLMALTTALLVVGGMLTTAPRAEAIIINYFQASLVGEEEVPSVQTRSSGLATFALNEEGTLLTYRISATDLTSAATEVGIYEGARGTVGRLLLSLGPSDPCSVGDDFVSCEGSVGDPEQLEALVPLMGADLAYVNILTRQYPGGELRGQISGMSPPEFGADLSGDHEVPVAETPAVGAALLRTGPDGRISFLIDAANIRELSEIGIFEGAIGDLNVRQLVRLNPAEQCAVLDNSIRCEGGDISRGDPQLSQRILLLMIEGRAYVNVRTSQYPGGEIAGQIR